MPSSSLRTGVSKWPGTRKPHRRLPTGGCVEGSSCLPSTRWCVRTRRKSERRSGWFRRGGETARSTPDSRHSSSRIGAKTTADYRDLDHGYAVTVHKAQGVSVDRAYVLADPMFDRHAGYVALSRHKQYCELRFGRDEFARSRDLVKALERERPKEMAVDYERAEKSNIALERRLEAFEKLQDAYEAAKTDRREARLAGRSVKPFTDRVDAQRQKLVEAAKDCLGSEKLSVEKRKELEQVVEREDRSRGRGMGFER
ncbi:MAG: hypothetical protein AAF605_08985 [Myxococcota bacterium]